ncbi:hypothetical protein WR25_11050 isoform A [Diploscapter pachys]|uniref:DEP domain-containing protein n=1 Tax=Diploscapter pachys TaxID=2018661 RepID=A0A2A2LTJ6_9BILA|nr:hypothetical protein WR25_11050 isoform A [Diploscapter pachys]
MSSSGISLRNHRRLAEEGSDASVEAASVNSNASSNVSASRPSSAVYLSFGQKEQFSSKELYKKIVVDFQESMAKKRNWRFFGGYETSFSGRDAVEYLLLNLGRFVSNEVQVQRRNCTLLLQKFIDMKVMEPYTDRDRGSFSEDKTYKLHSGTPFGFDSPSRSGSNPNLSEHIRMNESHGSSSNSDLSLLNQSNLVASRRSRLSISHGNLSSIAADSNNSGANTAASRRSMQTRRQALLQQKNSAEIGSHVDGNGISVPFTCAESSRRPNQPPLVSSQTYENWSVDDKSTDGNNGEREKEDNKENFYSALNLFGRRKSKDRARPKTPELVPKTSNKSDSRFPILFRKPSLKRNSSIQDKSVGTPIMEPSRPASRCGNDVSPFSGLLPTTNPPPRPRLLNSFHATPTDSVGSVNLRPTPCIKLTDLDEMRMWKSAWIECLSKYLSESEVNSIRNGGWPLNEKNLKWNAEQYESSGMTRAQWTEQGKDQALFSSSVISAMNFLTHYPRINKEKMLYYGENQQLDMFKTMCKQMELEEPLLTAAEGRFLLSILRPNSSTSISRNSFDDESSLSNDATDLNFSPPDFGNEPEKEKGLLSISPASTFGFGRTPRHNDSSLVRVNRLDGVQIAFRMDENASDEDKNRTASNAMHSGSNRVSINNPKIPIRKLYSPPRYEDVVRLPGVRQTAELDRKLKDLNISPNLPSSVSPFSSSYQTCPSTRNTPRSFASPLSVQDNHHPSARSSLQTSSPKEIRIPITEFSDLFKNSTLPVGCASLSAAALLLLSIDHTRRRRLQFGIKNLSMITTNYCLKLDPNGEAKAQGVSEENRYMVLYNLSRVVVPSSGPSDLASPSSASESHLSFSDSVRLAGLLIDNLKPLLLDKTICITIQNFAKAKMDDFILKKTEAEREGIAQITQPFCKTVSPSTYEAQKSDDKPLYELLDFFLNDQKMKPAAKLEKLKEFKRLYPHIYKERFPQCSPPSSSSAISAAIDDPITQLERQVTASEGGILAKLFKRT